MNNTILAFLALVFLSTTLPDAISKDVSDVSLTAKVYSSDGIISISYPKNYILLTKTSPQLFSQFKRMQMGLTVAEVFLTKDDLTRANHQELMEDQQIQVQLFPDDFPTITDKNWENVQATLVKTFSGDQGSKLLDFSANIGVTRYNNIYAAARKAKSISLNTPIIYSRSNRDIRWLIRGQISLEEGQRQVTIEAALVSALIRNGNGAFLLQSVTPANTTDEISSAVALFDQWVRGVQAE